MRKGRFNLSNCSEAVKRLNPALFVAATRHQRDSVEIPRNRREELQARYPLYPGIRSEAEAKVFQAYVEPLGVSWIESYESSSYVIVEGGRGEGVMYTPDFDFTHDGVHYVIEVKGHIRGLPSQTTERETLVKYKILRSWHPDWRFLWLEVKSGRIMERHTGKKTEPNAKKGDNSKDKRK